MIEPGENRRGLPSLEYFVQRWLVNAGDSAQDRQRRFSVSDIAPPSHLEKRFKGIGAKLLEQTRLTGRRESDQD